MNFMMVLHFFFIYRILHVEYWNLNTYLDLHSDFILFDEQGGQGHYVKPGPTKPDIMVDAIWDARLCTCNMNMDMVIKLCLVGVLLGFLVSSCWFTITKEHLLS